VLFLVCLSSEAQSRTVHRQSLIDDPVDSEKSNLDNNPAGGDSAKCPRCFREVRAGSKSCPKCGLVFTVWNSEAVRERTASRRTEDEDVHADLLWREVESRPDDESKHEAFLAYCREARCLDLAARRYQQFLLRNPESRTAFLFRDRVLLLAQFEPRAKPPTKVRSPHAHWLKWILVLGGAALLLGFFTARMLLRSSGI
jgi:hypothetical protein